MKKIKILSIILITLFISNPEVKAACSIEEESKLTKEARNVKASFEAAQVDVSKEPGFNLPDGMTEEDIANYTYMQDYFKIHISNLTENLYVIVKNNIANDSKKYYYSDTKDGEIVFDQMDVDRIYNYTIEVYATNNTECNGEKLYTVYTSTPMFNYMSYEPVCEGAEDYYACEKWLSTPLTDLDNLVNRIEKYKESKKQDEEKEKEEEKKKGGLKEFVKENKEIVIVSAICIVAIGGLVTVILVKKQRSKIV